MDCLRFHDSCPAALCQTKRAPAASLVNEAVEDAGARDDGGNETERQEEEDEPDKEAKTP